MSATLLSKFQIGNETVTIFTDAFVWLCPLFVCLSHGFKDTTLFRIAQMSEYKYFSLGVRCKLYIDIYLHLTPKSSLNFFIYASFIE